MEKQPIQFFKKAEIFEVEPVFHETGPEDGISSEIWLSSALSENSPRQPQKEETRMQRKSAVEVLLDNKGFKEIVDPELVIAVLEPKCNLKCEHCYWNHDIDYGKRAGEFSKPIDQIISWGADVAYAGRVLTPRAARFIEEYSRRSGKRIGIVDNGYTILTRPELFKYYNEVSISLDGVPEDHDRQRNQKGSFEVAWKAVKEMDRVANEEQDEERKDALSPIVSATFSPFNIDRWELFEDMLIQENIRMSCNPVLGVQENYDRNMPLFDEAGVQRAFEKVLGGMPKLINLYDPKHVVALLPQLKQFEWEIRQTGDALKTELSNGTIIVYKPLSVQTFGERVLLWTGDFHADADVAEANFTETATGEHLLSVANRFAVQDYQLVRELLRR